jgi:hypothetical protein
MPLPFHFLCRGISILKRGDPSADLMVRQRGEPQLCFAADPPGRGGECRSHTRKYSAFQVFPHIEWLFYIEK